MSTDLWKGLRAEARQQLETRDYSKAPVEERVSTSGVNASELIAADGGGSDKPDWWIPGVEVFSRRVFQQKQRGHFAEFARETDGKLAEIGMWPKQWATALMNAESAKGFHIHPPFIADDQDPEAWFQKLFVEEPENYSLRPYANEQWDAMFFPQGICEMFLVDERAGMPRRKMRFVIEGDDKPGDNNAGVVIPAGVAHSLQSLSTKDLIMVYGTSTTFLPENEGRIESGIEGTTMPPDWERYFLG
ncbi:hypothetical protein [Sulfuriroseicoccus oceanibius]|uniref:dTDP-4-dehydrorhamnose 3,5-epimerase n=1 Tax=Sulfuriroseicoccus oceanibius TaxID=2707525 RepID=A0A6B3LB75_9BACT|nr:hypothetical protein [Sulfuriroseicoccus oceanibius]QQL45232.1 hypothetical protein G3M56_001195 [Sulfuriroseicoccus oceanibius]